MADELAALIETAGDSVNQFEVRGTAPPPPPPAPGLAPRTAPAEVASPL